MLRRFTTSQLNQAFHHPELAALDEATVEHAHTVIRGLYRALRETVVKPPFQRPEHPVNGWGLVSTPASEHGTIFGIPAFTLHGCREIYLSTDGTMHRVLTMPDSRDIMKTNVLESTETSVPELLHEDPSLYPALLQAAEDNIEEFGLRSNRYIAPLLRNSLDA